MIEVIHLRPQASKPRRLEVHEHCFTAGPRASGWNYKFEHSHADGDIPHTHPDTGPATYTIDKDDWARATGLSGGGRKKFTAQPTGEQLRFVPRDPSRSQFEVIVCDPPKGFEGEGGGHHAAARMVLAFGLTPVVKDGRGDAA